MFPPEPNELEEMKGEMTQKICGKTMILWKVLPTSECTPQSKLLNFIFTFNLFPIHHSGNMTPKMVYLVGYFLSGNDLDLPSIICQVMISTSSSKIGKAVLPFGVMITRLLQKFKVN